MKVVKLKKTDDIADVIKIIKDLKDREVIFDIETGSNLLTSSSNLKLVKKTGEVMGKKIRVRTSDQTGRLLALKAEILEETTATKITTPMAMSGGRRSDVRPRFADIRRKKTPTIVTSARKIVPGSDDLLPEDNSFDVEKVDQPKNNRRSASKYFVMSLAVLILIAFALAVLLPTADITVYARSETVNRNVEVTVDKNISKIDPDKVQAPGTVIMRQVSQTKNFPTTGTKDIGTKAAGSVTLYNFTKNTLTLKASTTVLTVGSKKYYLTKDVTGLRPTAKIGSGSEEEIDQSTLISPVLITAEKPGEDFNLAANTHFAIINAALGNQNVYASNTNALSGGTSKTIKVVSQQDIDNAQADLTSSMAAQAETDLKAENPSNEIKIIPNSVNNEVLAKTANKKVGDEATTFDMTMIAKITGLSFNETEVKKMIRDKIVSVLSSDKYLLPDAQETLTITSKSVDIPAGKAVITASFNTVIAYKIDASGMKKLLAGKTANEIKEILLTKPEIDRVDVEFKPFFVNKAPKLNGKIHIQTMLSK